MLELGPDSLYDLWHASWCAALQKRLGVKHRVTLVLSGNYCTVLYCAADTRQLELAACNRGRKQWRQLKGEHDGNSTVHLQVNSSISCRNWDYCDDVMLDQRSRTWDEKPSIFTPSEACWYLMEPIRRARISKPLNTHNRQAVSQRECLSHLIDYCLCCLYAVYAVWCIKPQQGSASKPNPYDQGGWSQGSSADATNKASRTLRLWPSGNGTAVTCHGGGKLAYYN